MIDSELQLKIDQSTHLLASARNFVESANYDEATQCAREVLELLEGQVHRTDIGDESDTASQLYVVIDLVAHAYNRLVTVSVSRVQLDLARDQAEAGIKYAERIGNRLRVGHIYGNIGNIYLAVSDYPRSLEYYEKAVAIYEEHNNVEAVAKTTNNIGLVYGDLGDYTTALMYYEKALSINESIDNKSAVAMNLGNIGFIYEKLSEYAVGLEFSERALAIYAEIGNKEGIARALGNIGDIYYCQSQYSLALECFLKALALNEEIEFAHAVAYNYCSLGTLYSTQAYEGHDTGKAEYYLLKALELNNTLGIKQQNLDVFKNLADLYEYQKRWEAFDYLKRYYTLKEEVQSDAAKKQASLMEQRKYDAERERALAVERADADATRRLLLKTLPQSVADRVIQGQHRIADHFENVSILFGDVVGFTQLSATLPPATILDFMNFLFEHFDHIASKHGCERIKTIGDGYMAVCGAPEPHEDHAERIARMALEMMQDILLPEDIRRQIAEGTVLHLRIGLHCGEVTAGLIGTGKLAYDIYGDAVNLASRMESSGVPGKIHCSEEFVLHLQNRDESFVFEERGEIDIKGKGHMRTYFLESHDNS